MRDIKDLKLKIKERKSSGEKKKKKKPKKLKKRRWVKKSLMQFLFNLSKNIEHLNK